MLFHALKLQLPQEAKDGASKAGHCVGVLTPSRGASITQPTTHPTAQLPNRPTVQLPIPLSPQVTFSALRLTKTKSRASGAQPTLFQLVFPYLL